MQVFQPASQLLVHCLFGCYMLTAFGQDCACGMVNEYGCMLLSFLEHVNMVVKVLLAWSTLWVSAWQRFGKFCMIYNTGDVAAALSLRTSSNPSKHVCSMCKTGCALHAWGLNHTKHGLAAKVKQMACSACSPLSQRHCMYPCCHHLQPACA